jgi:hypothetical protein
VSAAHAGATAAATVKVASVAIKKYFFINFPWVITKAQLANLQDQHTHLAEGEGHLARWQVTTPPLFAITRASLIHIKSMAIGIQAMA